MSDPLDGARELLARARHHATDFKAQTAAIFGKDAYSQVVDTDPKTGEQVFKFKLVKTIPFSVNVIVMDAVNNLRSALDYCGFAFSGADEDAKSFTSFPFCDHPNEMPGRRRGVSRDIPPEVFAVMAAFHPYKGGDDLLWCINKIANTNKHRIIKPFGFGNVGSSMHTEEGFFEGSFSIGQHWNSSKNELELFRLGPGSSARLKANVTISTAVVFGKVPVVEGKEVLTTLQALSDKVESVINAIRAEAVRLGWLPA